MFKLDSMVYAVRRLCIPLDADYPVRQEQGGSNPRYRDMLTDGSKYWALMSFCRLKKTAAGERGEVLREVFLNMNLPFAPDDYDHTGLSSGWEAVNPVLARAVLKPLQRAGNGGAAARAVRVCDWVLDNIVLPGDVKRELTVARDGVSE